MAEMCEDFPLAEANRSFWRDLTTVEADNKRKLIPRSQAARKHSSWAERPGRFLALIYFDATMARDRRTASGRSGDLLPRVSYNS